MAELEGTRLTLPLLLQIYLINKDLGSVHANFSVLGVFLVQKDRVRNRVSSTTVAFVSRGLE